MNGLFGRDFLAEFERTKSKLTGTSLADRYLVPPFSIFDARSGYWQDRKRLWLSLGIQSELGRGGNSGPNAVSPGGSPRPATKLVNGRTVRGDGRGRKLAETYSCGGPGDLRLKWKQRDEQERMNRGNLSWVHGVRNPDTLDDTTSRKILDSGPQGTGTSIFDPTLCEILYRWFCPEGGLVLDPFAGGSVRGIIANMLGRKYTGVDLSQEQIEANRQQAETITPNSKPEWIVGDSRNIIALTKGSFDFLFSCPPYFDLEKYSYNPKDISNMSEEGFLRAYNKIIRRSLRLLKPNRFACFVVGDTRGKDHFYNHLPELTIKYFEDAGARLYNKAILITAVGSLPLRAPRFFEASRKLGRSHQHVLIFVKGSWKKAARRCKGE